MPHPRPPSAASKLVAATLLHNRRLRQEVAYEQALRLEAEEEARECRAEIDRLRRLLLDRPA